MLCIQTASRAASRAPGCHTLGSTPIKITSLHFYLHLETSSYSSFSSASVCSLCLLLLTPSSQEEVTFAAWQSNGTPGGVCPVWAGLLGPNNVLRPAGIQYATALQCSHTQRNNMPPTNMLVHTTCHLGAFTTDSY